jgi:hypothetical protein
MDEVYPDGYETPIPKTFEDVTLQYRSKMNPIGPRITITLLDTTLGDDDTGSSRRNKRVFITPGLSLRPVVQYEISNGVHAGAGDGGRHCRSPDWIIKVAGQDDDTGYPIIVAE